MTASLLVTFPSELAADEKQTCMCRYIVLLNILFVRENLKLFSFKIHKFAYLYFMSLEVETKVLKWSIKLHKYK